MDADELYRAPFDEFIARRDALARSLRKDGRREDADAVKALRKPALSAWALNQLPAKERTSLLKKGEALRKARGGDALRKATHAERDAVENLAASAESVLRDAGHTVTDKTASELRDTLHAAALDDQAREGLESGRLVAPRQAVGVFGGMPGASAPTSKRAPAKKKDDAEAKRKREREAAARAALRDAERAMREREGEAAAAQRALEKARAEVERRRSDLR